MFCYICQGRPVNLESTLDEIIAMGSADLNVLMAGESLPSSSSSSQPKPSQAPAPARGGTNSASSRGGGGGGNFYIAVANLRVRNNCEKDADVIADIPKSDLIEVLEERDDWFRIRLDGHDQAWIVSKNKARVLVEKTDPPAGYSAPAATAPTSKPAAAPAPAPAAKKPSAAASKPAPPPGATFYTISANMNVRDKPDGAADQISDLSKGDVIKVLETDGEWYRISLRGRDDLWIKYRTKVKLLVDELDPSVGNEKWMEQEAGGFSLAPDEEEKKKKVCHPHPPKEKKKLPTLSLSD
jgi:uncharacterized protein YgiM (DUF1202 family)